MPLNMTRIQKNLQRRYGLGSANAGPISVFADLLETVLGCDVKYSSLLRLYNSANKAYHSGLKESPLTDDDFDILQKYLLKRKLIERETGTKYTKSEEIELPHPMPSLEFERTAEDIASWVKKHKLVRLIATPKYDGISLYLRYCKGKFKFAATRGDGLAGKDVTRHAMLAPCIPKQLKEPVSCEVRCEIYLPESVFQKQFSVKQGGKFKTSRNLVSGTFGRNQPNVAVLKCLDCRVFEVFSGPITESGVAVKEGMLGQMGKLGLPVTDFILLNATPTPNLDLLLSNWQSKYDVLLDGLVLETHIYAQRRIIGLETNSIIPAYARAFKPLKDAVKAKVLSVGYSISKYNYLNPVINITPTEIGGVTVSNINGHNAGNMRDQGIGPGAIITISRRGDTIPHLESVLKPVKWEMPTLFGQLRWTINDKGEQVDLVAVESSEDHKIQQLLHFFEAMGVEYFNEKTVGKFYKHGFTSVPQILIAQVTVLEAKIPGIKEKSANRIRFEFDKLRNIGVTMPKLMYASGCFGRGFGEDKLQKIYDHYGDEIFDSWGKFTSKGIMNHVAALKGFTEKTGVAFANGLLKFKDFRNFTKDIIKVKDINKNGKLAGQTVVFTEFRDEVLKDLIKVNGGKYSNSLVKDTTILLRLREQVESKKTAEADKLGITVMTVADFKSKYNLKD